jgi:hypothetical protein
VICQDQTDGVDGLVAIQTFGVKTLECSPNLGNLLGELRLNDRVDDGVELSVRNFNSRDLVVLLNKVDLLLLIELKPGLCRKDPSQGRSDSSWVVS